MLKDKIKVLFLTASLLLCCNIARGQCSAVNTAFQSGELLSYNLYFNWKFVWVKVGTASMNITETVYKGKPAYRSYLITRGNSRADHLFMLRDTLTAYVGKDLVPWRYTKHAHEGKNYYRETVDYSYSGGKCHLKQTYSRNFLPWEHYTYDNAQCAFDMVSMLLRARSFNPEGWKPGHSIPFMMAEGRKCKQQTIVFRKKETFQVEGSNVKYRCLVFSFMEKQKNGKEKEIIKFFITDDKNHIPVRLDMNLNFGTAKAYLSSARGLRNPEGAKIK